MNKAFNTMVVFNGYPLSVVVAIVIHLLILGLLFYLQSTSNAETLELVQPTIVKALLIDENPQLAERRRLERAEMQRISEQRRRQEQEEAERRAEAERQRAEEERQRQEAEREQTALVERERQRQLELEREERQRQEQEDERRRQEEITAEQRRSEEQRRQQQEQDRLAQQAAAEAEAAEAARNEFELVQSATGLIQQLLQESWSRPPSARNGMRAVLQISMLPTGELIDVRITQSSGDAAFDRSAERAVYSAEPFSELQSLPIRVFNENFRSLTLTFEPQDLLN